MSEDLDFTAIDENGMSYEEILAAVEYENNKNAGKNVSTSTEGAKQGDEATVPQGMEASSFDDQNARGDATEFYETTTPGASMQPEAMQEESNEFATTKNSGGGKENSSNGANASSKTGQPKLDGKSSAKEGGSPADDITREAGIVLENKVQEVQEWCKKLLEEITVYVQVANKTNEEYLRIQQLEHQESERLDGVEPDVKGATSQLLGGFPFYAPGEAAAGQNQNAAAAARDENRVE